MCGGGSSDDVNSHASYLDNNNTNKKTSHILIKRNYAAVNRFKPFSMSLTSPSSSSSTTATSNSFTTYRPYSTLAYAIANSVMTTNSVVVAANNHKNNNNHHGGRNLLLAQQFVVTSAAHLSAVQPTAANADKYPAKANTTAVIMTSGNTKPAHAYNNIGCSVGSVGNNGGSINNAGGLTATLSSIFWSALMPFIEHMRQFLLKWWLTSTNSDRMLGDNADNDYDEDIEDKDHVDGYIVGGSGAKCVPAGGIDLAKSAHNRLQHRNNTNNKTTPQLDQAGNVLHKSLLEFIAMEASPRLIGPATLVQEISVAVDMYCNRRDVDGLADVNHVDLATFAQGGQPQKQASKSAAAPKIVQKGADNVAVANVAGSKTPTVVAQSRPSTIKTLKNALLISKRSLKQQNKRRKYLRTSSAAGNVDNHKSQPNGSARLTPAARPTSVPASTSVAVSTTMHSIATRLNVKPVHKTANKNRRVKERHQLTMDIYDDLYGDRVDDDDVDADVVDEIDQLGDVILGAMDAHKDTSSGVRCSSGADMVDCCALMMAQSFAPLMAGICIAEPLRHVATSSWSSIARPTTPQPKDVHTADSANKSTPTHVPTIVVTITAAATSSSSLSSSSSTACDSQQLRNSISWEISVDELRRPTRRPPSRLARSSDTADVDAVQPEQMINEMTTQYHQVLLAAVRQPRERQISECSDDFICFERDDDENADNIAYNPADYDETDSEDEEEDDDNDGGSEEDDSEEEETDEEETDADSEEDDDAVDANVNKHGRVGVAHCSKAAHKSTDVVADDDYEPELEFESMPARVMEQHIDSGFKEKPINKVFFVNSNCPSRHCLIPRFPTPNLPRRSTFPSIRRACITSERGALPIRRRAKANGRRSVAIGHDSRIAFIAWSAF